MDLPEEIEILSRFQKRQVMPVFQVLVEPVWHRQNVAELGSVFRAQAEHRRNQAAHQLAVEGVAGDAYAVSAEDLARRFSLSQPAGLQLYEREIAGAATEVGDENRFLMVESPLVLICCGHGLGQKVYFIKSRVAKSAAQSVDGEFIVDGIFGAAEVHGTADNKLASQVAELRFR